MNERIKQITGQVLDELVPETWVALGYDKIKEIQNRTAELIIQECAEVINDGVLNNDGSGDWINGYNAGATECLRKINEHFGVEE